MLSFSKKASLDKLIVIDPTFPQKTPFAFRNAEINEYFRRIINVTAYTMYPMKPGPEAWFAHSYGMERSAFKENLKGYLKYYPENRGRIKYLTEKGAYNGALAYSYFLAETYTLLPFLEKNKLPFVFILYPGGSFGLDNEASDHMLKKICSSKYFKGMIVTQKITEDYLTRKNLCAENKMTYIYGGITQFKKDDVLPKRYYKKDKSTFDVCFLGAKYSEKGVDKGYDLFIETAKLLCKKSEDIMFHVIGPFTAADIDIKGFESRIKFYGYRRPDFLAKFYSKMDVMLCPNRPFKLYEGNFDGFPLGNDAQYCGVAMFASDELSMNRYYTDGKDIVIVPLDSKKIAGKILHYYSNLEEFYQLSNKGRELTQTLFDLEHQINQRIKFFKKFVNLKDNE